MDGGFGIELPHEHANAELRKPARYVVVIDAGGSGVARLFSQAREALAEFDAGAEESAALTKGLRAAPGAEGPEWDQALAGHSREERIKAEVYTLEH